MAGLLINILLIFVICLFLAYLYLTRHFNQWKRLGILGPKPKLFYGTFQNAIWGKRHIIYDFEDIYNKYKNCARAIGVFLTRDPEILVIDPSLAHEIMVTNFNKFRDNMANKWVMDKKADKIVACNPFFAVMNEWKIRRNDMQGGLTLSKLHLAYPIWKEIASKLTQYLERKTEINTIIECKNLCLRFTAEILGDFLWGINADTLNVNTSANVIIQKSSRMLQEAQDSVSFWYSLSLVPFLRRYFNKRLYSSDTDEFFSKLTQDAIELRLKEITKHNRADFLNYVIELKKKKGLMHDDIVGYMLTTLLDGYETSANIMAHTLFYLAKYENAQHRLREEILENLDCDGYMNFDKINSLKFLDQCLQETIRMITPIPSFTRINIEPVTIELSNGKFVQLDSGTVFNIPIFVYHHDAEYFPEPWKYKPERFDGGSHVEMTKRGVLMTFGEGPRICVGMRLALLQMKSFLVQILKDYQLKCCIQTMAEKKPDSNDFIFGLAGDIWLELERIQC